MNQTYAYSRYDRKIKFRMVSAQHFINEAPGIDGIEGELIKGVGEAVVHIMHKICNNIWVTGEFPILRTKSLVVTIPKKRGYN